MTNLFALRPLRALALTIACTGLPVFAATTAPPDGASVRADAPASTPPKVSAERAMPMSAEAERRLKVLSEELRCLVCQNQTLADSNADLAVDLRNQVNELIASGRSDEQIKSFLVERYGDFVLYRPPVQNNTLLLWFGPFVLLLGGVLIWWLVQRRSGAPRADGDASAATPSRTDDAALRRARAMLDD